MLTRCTLSLFLAFLCWATSTVSSYAQTSIGGVINRYAAVLEFTDCNAFRVEDAGGFGDGDLVLIIQMQGSLIDLTNTPMYGGVLDYRSAGLFELARIQSINGRQIVLTAPLKNQYQVEGKVQMISVPEYDDVRVSRTLTCDSWDGMLGGVVALSVSSSIRFDADIDVTGKGFRGGLSIGQRQIPGKHFTDYVGTDNPDLYGKKGEGIAGTGSAGMNSARGAPANGGGGGNQHNAGAGGGANGGCGGQGGWAYKSPSYAGDYKATNGDGGHSLPVDGTRIFLGGGGGAGHGNDDGETDGVNGGGIVILLADSVLGEWHLIRANGLSSNNADQDGCGGAGAGGTVCLDVKNVLSPLTIQAAGGNGGNTVHQSITGPGGGGGGGVVHYSGTTLPANIVVQSVQGGTGGVASDRDRYGAVDGCPGMIRGNFLTFSRPEIPLICPGESVPLSAPAGTWWQWEPAEGLSCADCPNPIASPRETTIYRVTAWNGEGCPTIEEVEIRVRPDLALSAGADYRICFGDSVRLVVRGKENQPIGREEGFLWQWEPAEGLNCTDCPDPVAAPTKTTSYIMNVTAPDGCRYVDTVVVGLPDDTTRLSFRIGRDYKGGSDQPIVVAVEWLSDVEATSITRLEFELGYDPKIMKPDVETLKGLLIGTALEGWEVDVLLDVSGVLILRFTAPPGMTLVKRPDLFRFIGQLYLSDRKGTELPFEIRASGSCFAFEEDPGYAELDICGLNFRLIELTAEKYVPPVVWPNPARDRVHFEFGLGLDGPTQLELFDGLGKRVGVLVAENLAAGRYSVEWDVRGVSTGRYWYRLRSGDWSEGGEVQVEH